MAQEPASDHAALARSLATSSPARASWLAFALLTLLSGVARAKGVDAQKLSLPQGPASIEGLGRSFTPSLASGTSSYGIELSVPPAVGGFSPKLSLEYDSGTGASELGMGWRLGGIPSIRRRVNQGLPRFDETDSFELSGLGIPCDLLTLGAGVYRPEYETGSFVRIQRAADGATWEARDKSGAIYRFGGDGFVEGEGRYVATYLLNEQRDRHGHSIRYQWKVANGYALLSKVAWNEVSDVTRLEVVFGYEARPDVVVRFSSGIRQVLAERLSSIDVTRGGALVRRYSLDYGAGTHPQLTALTLAGTDGATLLPRLSFGYTETSFAPRGPVVSMRSAPGFSPSDDDVAITDLDGDGLPDLLVTRAGQYRTYLNHDGTSWRAGQDWATADSPALELATTGVELADLDGDGAVDLVAKSGTSDFRYFPGKDATHFAPPVAIKTIPNFTFEDPDARLADMDGDRRTDVVITTAAGLAIGYNLGGRDWTVPETVGVVDATQPLKFSDGFTQLCDLNGDRIPDVCHLKSGSLQYWLGRGRGRFETAAAGAGVPTWDPSNPWQLVDLDGDGWVDLVRVGVDQVQVALATAVGQFAAPRTVTGIPQRLPTTAVEFHDMNGSGTADIVWIDPSSSPDRAWRYLELFPSGRGGLLSKIDNGLGKVVSIAYEPSAVNAARAREAGRAWSSRMNVAMPVVRRVEVDSSLGAVLGDPVIATEYAYRDGTWDARERTFGAFGSGTEQALGDGNTPTLVTENTFDTGTVHRVLRGSVLTTEQADARGHVFSRATNVYRTKSVAAALDGRSVEYAYRSSERVDHVEAGDPSAARTTLTEWEQDEFGNVVHEAKWGIVVGSDQLAGHDEMITIRTFANNAEDWLLGRIASEEIQDAFGHRLALRRSYYDGDAFQGLGLRQVGRGDLRRVESWIAGEHIATEAAFDHDGHGNVIVALDARGGRSEYDYDPESRTFIVGEKRYPDDQTALSWRADYDARFGKPISITEPNGARVDLKYDALGRLTSVIQPGDSANQPTVSYTYRLGAPLSTIRAAQREVSGQDGTLVTITHVDGLGRHRGKLTESARAGYWILADWGAVDARGNPSFVAFPTEERSADLPRMDSRTGTRTEYDALGRAVATRHVDGSSSSVVYGPFARTVWDENDSDPGSPQGGTPTTYLSDGLGRLTQVIEREATRAVATGTYSYDALGNVTEVADAQGTLRKYDYDGRSRRVGIHDPNAGDWQLFYTDGNDLERRVDPAGHVLRWTYDQVGRTTDEWHRRRGTAEETRVTRYHYDACSSEHGEYRNVKGRLAWVEDAAGTQFFGYNSRGLVSEQTRRWSDGKEHTTWTDYDAADRPIRRGYPDRTYLSLRYDSHGQLAALGPIVPELSWAPHGALSGLKLGNGVVDRRDYDQRRRLERMTARDPAGTALRDLELTLDPASRITRVTDLRPALAAVESQTVAYAFDDRYRLTAAQDAIATTRWNLDDTAKILAVESGHDDGWLNVTNRYGENDAGPDQLTRHGTEVWAYDEAGRVVRDAERTLAWDAKGRASQITRGSTVEAYVYAHDDERAIKQTIQDGSTTTVRYVDADVEERRGDLVRYVFVGDQRVARLDGLASDGAASARAPELPVSKSAPRSGSTRGWFVLLSGLLLAPFVPWRRAPRRGWTILLPRLAASASCAAVLCLLVLPSCEDDEHPARRDPRYGAKEITELPAATVFYLADWQNSPVARIDAQGQVLSRTVYHPYGSVRSSTGQRTDPWGFAGNELDEGTGLRDFHARPYRAELGVFLAPDRVGVFEIETLVQAPEHLRTAATPKREATSSSLRANDAAGRPSARLLARSRSVLTERPDRGSRPRSFPRSPALLPYVYVSADPINAMDPDGDEGFAVSFSAAFGAVANWSRMLVGFAEETHRGGGSYRMQQKTFMVGPGADTAVSGEIAWFRGTAQQYVAAKSYKVLIGPVGITIAVGEKRLEGVGVGAGFGYSGGVLLPGEVKTTLTPAPLRSSP